MCTRCERYVIYCDITCSSRATLCLKTDCKSCLVLDQFAEVVDTSEPAITLISSNLPDLKKRWNRVSGKGQCYQCVIKQKKAEKWWYEKINQLISSWGNQKVQKVCTTKNTCEVNKKPRKDRWTCLVKFNNLKQKYHKVYDAEKSLEIKSESVFLGETNVEVSSSFAYEQGFILSILKANCCNIHAYFEL